MNLPNKLTLLRILLVPVFVAFLLWESLPKHALYALLIFSVASLTDLLDGKIARKYNLVTNFGKFMDPIADKLLICAAYTAFVQLGICSAWAVILILAREFTVTSLRLVAVGEGTVIAANYWGKVKTASQMTVTILVMALRQCDAWRWIDGGVWMNPLCAVLIWVSVALTVISGIVYLLQNKKFLNPAK